jgi:hypothetical protein
VRSATVDGGNSRLEAANAGDNRTLIFLGGCIPTDKIPEQVGVLHVYQLLECVAFNA